MLEHHFVKEIADCAGGYFQGARGGEGGVDLIVVVVGVLKACC